MTLCIIDSSNHSNDQMFIQSGRSYSIPVCGFHEMKHRNDQTIYMTANEIAKIESQYIVWEETHEGNITAILKSSRRAAKLAYGKIDRERGVSLKSYGWSHANDAQPTERRAAGLSAFPIIIVPMFD